MFPPTVMIVEDDSTVIYMMERYAQRSKCQVITTCGIDALALAKEETPAVIMLDILMPGMDGWQVLRALRGDPVTCDIPVVLCSALDEQARGQAEGADYYLKKPILYRDFVIALTSVGIRI